MSTLVENYNEASKKYPVVIRDDALKYYLVNVQDEYFSVSFVKDIRVHSMLYSKLDAVADKEAITKDLELPANSTLLEVCNVISAYLATAKPTYALTDDDKKFNEKTGKIIEDLFNNLKLTNEKAIKSYLETAERANKPVVKSLSTRVEQLQVKLDKTKHREENEKRDKQKDLEFNKRVAEIEKKRQLVKLDLEQKREEIKKTRLKKARKVKTVNERRAMKAAELVDKVEEEVVEVVEVVDVEDIVEDVKVVEVAEVVEDVKVVELTAEEKEKEDLRKQLVAFLPE